MRRKAREMAISLPGVWNLGKRWAPTLAARFAQRATVITPRSPLRVLPDLAASTPRRRFPRRVSSPGRHPRRAELPSSKATQKRAVDGGADDVRRLKARQGRYPTKQRSHQSVTEV